MDEHQADWPLAGERLRALLARYQGIRTRTEVMSGLAGAAGVTLRQARRYLGGARISHPQSEAIATWLCQALEVERAEITDWLEATDYPRPGQLVARLFDPTPAGRGRRARHNLPNLGNRLWGPFLGRTAELAWARSWADQQRHPIAALHGFGGNGKTALQLKIGLLFADGPGCVLRYPYQGVVWVSGFEMAPGRPDLLDVLRAVVQTFGVVPPETLAATAPAWIQETAQQLLEQERVLVLLDNFESVAPAHQQEILSFFDRLHGTSQMLISTRYDLNADPERTIVYRPIPVGGLTPEDSDQFILDYLAVRQPEADTPALTAAERTELATTLAYNPKAMEVALGLVTGGHLPLVELLRAVQVGRPEADTIFAKVVGRAWEEVLDEPARRVLLAKALFSQPASREALGRVAGVDGSALGHAVRTLQTISFFERAQAADPRVRTHPLAQDYARRRWQDPACAGLTAELEARWWETYVPTMVRRARAATYGDLQTQPGLADDLTSVLEQITEQVQTAGTWQHAAATAFAGPTGLGEALRQLGRWDDVVPVAELVLARASAWGDARQIGVCAIKLLASVHRERSRPDLAEADLSRATDLNVELADPWLTATINRERGLQHRRRGHFRAAKEAFEGALRIYEDLDDLAEIASTLQEIAGTTVDLASADLGATDPDWATRAAWEEAEQIFQRGDRYWEHHDPADPQRRFHQTATRAWRGVMARLQNDLPQARQLFEGCLGQFQSLLSEARLRRELALVEHLAGNRELAYIYEDEGLRLFRQVGAEQRTPHNCYRVIDQWKQEGRW